MADQYEDLVIVVERVVKQVVTEEIGPMRADFAEVHRVITGNGFGLNRGLVDCVKDLEASDKKLCKKIDTMDDRIDNLDRREDRRWDRVKWIIVGSALGGGGLVTGGSILIERFIGG